MYNYIKKEQLTQNCVVGYKKNLVLSDLQTYFNLSSNIVFAIKSNWHSSKNKNLNSFTIFGSLKKVVETVTKPEKFNKDYLNSNHFIFAKTPGDGSTFKFLGIYTITEVDCSNNQIIITHTLISNSYKKESVSSSETDSLIAA